MLRAQACAYRRVLLGKSACDGVWIPVSPKPIVHKIVSFVNLAFVTCTNEFVHCQNDNLVDAFVSRLDTAHLIIIEIVPT